MMQRVAIYVRQTGTEPEIYPLFLRLIQHHGDTVLPIHADDRRLNGRGKYAAWHRLIANLDTEKQRAKLSRFRG